MTRLTAEELKILPEELEALIWVRDCLATNTMPEWMRFDMNNWGLLNATRPLSCGTRCCIGGSMEIYLAGLAAKAPTHIVSFEESAAASNAFERLHAIADTGRHGHSAALEGLFFRYSHREINSDTPEGAIQAIDRFLAGETYNPWGETLDVV